MTILLSFREESKFTLWNTTKIMMGFVLYNLLYTKYFAHFHTEFCSPRFCVSYWRYKSPTDC